jgi:hypothetical protein
MGGNARAQHTGDVWSNVSGFGSDRGFGLRRWRLWRIRRRGRLSSAQAARDGGSGRCGATAGHREGQCSEVPMRQGRGQVIDERTKVSTRLSTLRVYREADPAYDRAFSYHPSHLRPAFASPRS